MSHTKSLAIGGKTITLETGRLAKQAHGAVLISLDDSYVLCTVTASDEAKPGQDFFPLTVDYREKTASVGKIPGGFFKREARPTEKEILSSRLIDRPIRPMFPEGFFNEVQILCSVYSSDRENDPDVIAAIGASACLMISDVPFEDPISEVRVTRLDGELIINPTYDQVEKGDFDITIAGTTDSIMMVEGEAREISEAEFLEAIKFGHKFIAEICEFQKEFAKEIGKKKRELNPAEDISEMINDVKSICEADIKTVTGTILSKEERRDKNKEIFDKVITALTEKYPEQEKKIGNIIHDIQYDVMRDMILNEGKRLDGRGMKDIRQISSEVAVLPRTHGSALFTRGQTQSLTTVTLGTKRDEQMIEGLKELTTKRFILHYNFPPFSTGEVGGRPGPGRREIGHGNLAERALKNLLPPEEDFPYTIRILSDILESNGSSSMATVCAGSLALMDAGVKLKKPIAGIAMGLIKEKESVAILSDILGDEDHFGDMDFKVAGTADGITAIQMDIKIRGISFDIMEKALAQAREGRLHILGEMKKTLDTPRESISKYAPHLYSMNIPKEMIGAVIGPGGKTIRHIIAESGAEINIDDEGVVTIAAIDKEQAAIARKMIEGLTEVPEIGKIYEGKIKGIKDFGAFVEIIPGKEGLLHISEIDNKRVMKVEDVLKIGQIVQVKLMGIDDSGKLKLSRKILLPKESAKPKEQPKEQ
ncbi:MAG TPA: polyribonucleotide nucleotidyltransferase [Ignavibacteria bacterium]|nr:polyribonucleotide nucleotidyltransferase [Ignavibacteria bacterium]